MAKLLLYVLAVGSFILLASGIIYGIVGAMRGRLHMLIPYGGRLSFIHPEIGEQLLGESILVMILLGIGGAGCLSLSKAISSLRKPDEAWMLLVVGLLLLALACAGLGWIFYFVKF